MSILVGTSGWSYDHWKGNFYPEDIKKRKWLEFYTKKFDTVELNASFYRLPREKTFENWHKRTPENFKFSVKMSRYVTHIKKLNDPQDTLPKFFQRVKKLKEKCPVILVQLPPSLKFKKKKAEKFMKELTSYSYRFTLECRNKSWFSQKSYELMSQYGIALCLADTPRYPYEEELTSPEFIYIRLHGHEKLYASNTVKNNYENGPKR